MLGRESKTTLAQNAVNTRGWCKSDGHGLRSKKPHSGVDSLLQPMRLAAASEKEARLWGQLTGGTSQPLGSEDPD